MKKRIYIVDDEPKIGELFATVLRRDGFQAQSFVNPVVMLEEVDKGEIPDVVLADLMMPGMNGIELIESFRSRKLMLPIIIMTGHSSVQTAVEAMRLGAFHYLQKPVNLEEMRTLLRKALDLYDAKQELEQIKSRERAAFPVSGILGRSDAIERLRETVRMLRDVPNTIVLIRGETGTGKNLVARTIHHNSPFTPGRFVEINCAALPDNLLEAELFGYEKGAFTDARASKPGLLEVADGGTLFLDEIDSMSIALQSKLLSFLENRTFRRLSGVEDIKVTTRILCATNSNLEARVMTREFRKDLFFRINVVSLYMPPLRDMGEDIMIVAHDIVKRFNRELNRDIAGFTAAAREKLLAHPWPGNVRELRNVLERAMIFTKGNRIDARDLTLTPPDNLERRDQDESGMFRFKSGGSLEELEYEYIRHILESTNGSYTDVAKTLGISKKTLWEKRKKFNLDLDNMAA